jgi:hypothetical protein
MSHKSEQPLTEEQKQEIRGLVLTEFYNLHESPATVQKSLLIAFKGFLESVDGEDQAYSHTVDTIGEDIFMVCALLEYLHDPGKDESVYDIRGMLHFTPSVKSTYHV